MRLIDADALAKELMHEGLGYQYNRVINAPTVDAIPISFIEEMKAWAEENGFDMLFANDLAYLLSVWAERNDS